ncbi:Hypothetical protein A7982_01474 [Minicystis rosea]|nr:Hypothetical protein A7982_01474 [Minicystis rosea]
MLDGGERLVSVPSEDEHRYPEIESEHHRAEHVSPGAEHRDVGEERGHERKLLRGPNVHGGPRAAAERALHHLANDPAFPARREPARERAREVRRPMPEAGHVPIPALVRVGEREESSDDEEHPSHARRALRDGRETIDDQHRALQIPRALRRARRRHHQPENHVDGRRGHAEPTVLEHEGEVPHGYPARLSARGIVLVRQARIRAIEELHRPGYIGVCRVQERASAARGHQVSLAAPVALAPIMMLIARELEHDGHPARFEQPAEPIEVLRRRGFAVDLGRAILPIGLGGAENGAVAGLHLFDGRERLELGFVDVAAQLDVDRDEPCPKRQLEREVTPLLGRVPITDVVAPAEEAHEGAEPIVPIVIPRDGEELRPRLIALAGLEGQGGRIRHDEPLLVPFGGRRGIDLVAAHHQNTPAREPRFGSIRRNHDLRPREERGHGERRGESIAGVGDVIDPSLAAILGASREIEDEPLAAERLHGSEIRARAEQRRHDDLNAGARQLPRIEPADHRRPSRLPLLKKPTHDRSRYPTRPIDGNKPAPGGALSRSDGRGFRGIIPPGVVHVRRESEEGTAGRTGGGPHAGIPLQDRWLDGRADAARPRRPARDRSRTRRRAAEGRQVAAGEGSDRSSTEIRTVGALVDATDSIHDRGCHRPTVRVTIRGP